MQELWGPWSSLILAPSFPRAQPVDPSTGTTVSFPNSNKEFQACSPSLSVSPFCDLAEIIPAAIKTEFSLSSLAPLRGGRHFPMLFVGCQRFGGGPSSWNFQVRFSGRATLARCLAGKISPLFSSEDLGGPCRAASLSDCVCRVIGARHKVW